MLPLPRFLNMDDPTEDRTAVTDALRTTGHFLEVWLMPAMGRNQLPAARGRLISALAREKG